MIGRTQRSRGSKVNTMANFRYENHDPDLCHEPECLDDRCEFRRNDRQETKMSNEIRRYRLHIDLENNSESWWDALASSGRMPPPALRALAVGLRPGRRVRWITAAERDAALAFAATLPGWDNGPEYARHPFTVETKP